MKHQQSVEPIGGAAALTGLSCCNKLTESTLEVTTVKRRHVYVILISLLALLAASCGNDDNGDTADADGDGDATAEATEGADGLEELVASAEEEGTLSLYTSLADEHAADVAAAFEATYDIDVDVLRLGPTDLVQRFSSEAEAGAVTADIIVSGATGGFFEQGLEEGWLTSLEETRVPELVPDFPEDFLRSEFGSAAVILQTWNVAYNTDIVTGDDVPETWEDVVTNPLFEGRTLLVDPRNTDLYFDVYETIYDQFGPDWFSSLEGEIGFDVINSGVPGAQAVAAGESAVMYPTGAAAVLGLSEEGAPIDVANVTPQVGIEVVFGISADAPHPNAARLMAQFLMSEEGSAEANALEGVTSSPYDPPAGYTSPPQGATEHKDEIMELLGLA